MPSRQVAGVAGLQLVVQALRQLILGSGIDYLHASSHVPRNVIFFCGKNRGRVIS